MGSVTNIISQRFVFNNSIPNVNEFSVVLLLVSAASLLLTSLKSILYGKNCLCLLYILVMPYVTPNVSGA